jgi:rhodanese-related sulfurtransferase
MAFSEEDVRKNREYFAEKLRAERQLTEVQAWAKKEPGAPQIALLDTRSRDAFAKGHIPGAVSAPVTELSQLASQLPRDKELVTYCWSKT